MKFQNMSNSFVQLRVSDEVKTKASKICERLGIDIPTYLCICMARLIEENGIPFSMKLECRDDNSGVATVRETQQQRQKASTK